MRQNKPVAFRLALLLTGCCVLVRAETAGLGAGSAESPDGGSAPAVATEPFAPGWQPLNGRERWNLYAREAFWSPGVFFRSAGPALGAQLNNEPAEWGQGAGGYGKRFANRFGRSVLQETIEAGGASLLQHEVRYVRSRRSGFLPRAAHALAANFVTYDRSGRRTPHISRVGAAFAAEFTGSRWMPDGHRGASTAMRGVGIGLGAGSAFNLVREFAPELKRILPWR